MTDQRELNRLLDAFFVDGTNELADRVIDAALDQIDDTPQRRVVRVPRRFSTMNMPFRLATAAVIGVLAVGGISYVLRTPPADVGPSPATPTPASLGPTTGPSAIRTAGPTRAPITGTGPCRDGRIDIRPVDGFVEMPPAVEEIQHPSGGRIAMALEASSTNGVIVVSVPSPIRLRVIATFTGEDVQSPAGVQVLGWSPAGDALLVLAQNEHFSDSQKSCGNYFVVRADGSAVQRLTDYGPDERPDGGVFSPSGTSVAYTLGSVLHVAPLNGGSRTIPTSCLEISGELRWTQDERHILVQCADGLLIVEVASGQARWVPLDPGPLDARWTSNDQGIVVAVGDDVPGLTGGPLSILDVDVADLTVTTRVRSDVSTEWVLGVPSLSPNTERLLVLGGGDIPDLPYYPTYLVETANGTTTKLPWPVMADSIDDPHRRRPVVTWLSGYESVLTVQDGTLYEVFLERIGRMDVGSVPENDFAWFVTE